MESTRTNIDRDRDLHPDESRLNIGTLAELLAEGVRRLNTRRGMGVVHGGIGAGAVATPPHPDRGALTVDCPGCSDPDGAHAAEAGGGSAAEGAGQ
ncbi:MAG: hypothetical protein IBJ18_02105 [Phycisphaerales bacterium]|nr:hypothetical protein [Phycisphaerales bacterium]